MQISGNCVLLFIFLGMISKCKNCFLFDEEKLNSYMNYFPDKHSLTLFLLNVILNIQDKYLSFCKFDGKNICILCQGNIYYREYEYTVY